MFVFVPLWRILRPPWGNLSKVIAKDEWFVCESGWMFTDSSREAYNSCLSCWCLEPTDSRRIGASLLTCRGKKLLGDGVAKGLCTIISWGWILKHLFFNPWQIFGWTGPIYFLVNICGNCLPSTFDKACSSLWSKNPNTKQTESVAARLIKDLN